MSRTSTTSVVAWTCVFLFLASVAAVSPFLLRGDEPPPPRKQNPIAAPEPLKPKDPITQVATDVQPTGDYAALEKRVKELEDALKRHEEAIEFVSDRVYYGDVNTIREFRPTVRSMFMDPQTKDLLRRALENQ